MLHHNVRIPGSRPFRPPSQKPKPPRDQSWDNRFHLGKMPEYDALLDPNLKASHFVKTRKKVLVIGDKPKKFKKPVNPLELAKCVSVKGLKRPVIQSTIVSNLSRKLEDLWDFHNIPSELRTVFFASIDKLPPKEKSSAIVKETESLKIEKNAILTLARAVKKREDTLQQLIDFAEQIDVPTNATKSACVENLLSLRNNTLSVVEAVEAWKKKTRELGGEEDIEFVWEGENYLKKIISDFRMLSQTKLVAFIDLWENDPFFMHSKGERGKVEIPAETGIFKRVKDAELALRKQGMAEVVKDVPQTPRRLTECRSSRVFQKEEAKELSLEPVTGEIEEQICQYSLLVPENIQESLGRVENVYNTAMALRYPAFLLARIGRETVGLISLNLENQKSMQKRLFISHFSVIQQDMIEKLLDLVLDFIWKNYDCIEIRVGIISKVTDQGKYEADKSIKQFFDSKGFRWKQMIYTLNQVPVQLLGLRRPDSFPIPQIKNSIFDDNIEMAYACSVQVADQQLDRQTSLNYCSIVGLSCAVKALGSCSVPEITDTNNRLKGIPPAFRFRKDNKLDLAIKDLQSVQLYDPGLKDGLDTSVSCSALGLSWVKYLPAKLEGKSYTKVFSGVLKMSSQGVSIYLISTEDPQYSIFIIPAQNTQFLFTSVRALLKGLVNEGEIDDIWIPSFEITDLKNVGIDGQTLADQVIQTCNEMFRFKVVTGSHVRGGVDCTPTSSSVVIRDSFHFVMIHHKIDEELEVPLFVIHVPAESFI